MMKNFTIAIIAMILLSFLSPVVAMQPKDDEVSAMTPVIIEFNDKVDKKLLENNGGKIKIEYKLRPAVAASLPPKAIENLRKNPNIKSIVDDIEIHTMEYGTSYYQDWGITQIGADQVHDRGNTGETINVAILDTGADLDHPDLWGNIVYDYDFSGHNDYDASDRDGHGTHVAGTVGALLNDKGVVGVAPNVNLYILKVFTDSGKGYYSDIREALEWCYGTRNDVNPDNDIHIVSMSLGSKKEYGDPGLEPTINDLYNAGILIFGAAGNYYSDDDNVIYPARYENVIAVAATDLSNVKADFSCTGPAVEIAAPGVSIKSTYLWGFYATMGGTSMATPHAAGTAALVMVANPGISNVQVRQILQNTADDLGATGRDNLYGFGLVDANEAAVSISSNQPPMVVNDEYSVNEDDILDVAAPGVLGNDSDADGNPLTAIIVSDVSKGTLVLNADGSFTYTPNLNFAGTDCFTYTANDGIADSNIANVTITVNPVNDAPFVGDIPGVSFPENGSDNTIDLDDYVDDVDNTDTEISWTYIGITNVIVDIDSNTHVVTFTAEPDWNGQEVITFTATDPGGLSDSDASTVIVTPSNQPPVVSDIPDVSFHEDGSDSTIDLDDYVDDMDNADTEVSWTYTGTTNVIVDIDSNTNVVTFTVEPDWNGQEVITFTATDPGGLSDSDLSTVIVTSVNDAPVAVYDAYSMDEGNTLSMADPGVLGNDMDVDGDPLTAIMVSNVSNGTLALNADGSFTYTPNPNFVGTDIFTYSANDGTADSNIATVTITVNTAPQTIIVSNIEMSFHNRTAGKNTFTHAIAEITVFYSGGTTPVEGATVSGQWSVATDSYSGITNAEGRVLFDSDNVKNAADGTTFTFTVTNVDLPGSEYSSDLSVTEGSITYNK